MSLKHFNLDEAQRKLAEVFNSNSEYTMDNFMNEFEGQEQPMTNHKIFIDYVNTSNNQEPDWETSGSAGFDLRASETGSIKPNEFKIVPTGLFFDLPENFEIQVRPRSGLAAKHGVTVLNSPGTIDSDYTGEIKVILINHGTKTFNIAEGDRIAQAVISTVTAKNIINLNKIDKITKKTHRAEGGFGSTGIK